MRVGGAEQIGVKAIVEQHIAGNLARRGSGIAVYEGAKRHGTADRHARVERGSAVLEHHLHLAAQLGDRNAIRCFHTLAIEDKFSGVSADEMHQQAGQD